MSIEGITLADWVDNNFEELEKKFLQTSDGMKLLDDQLAELGDNPDFQSFCEIEYADAGDRWEAVNE